MLYKSIFFFFFVVNARKADKMHARLRIRPSEQILYSTMTTIKGKQTLGAADERGEEEKLSKQQRHGGNAETLEILAADQKQGETIDAVKLERESETL